jgi:hypothetical protein
MYEYNLKRKAWLFVISAIIVFSQITILNSFFHPFDSQGITINTSIVEIGKMSYVYGWASITVGGPTGIGYLANGTEVRLNPIIQFSNGTQIVVNSTFTFKMVFPRTGSCFGCSGATGIPGNNGQTLASLDPSHPIVAAIVTNASSFLISTMHLSGSTPGDLFQFYWFVIQGDASVSVNGYSVAY